MIVAITTRFVYYRGHGLLNIISSGLSSVALSSKIHSFYRLHRLSKMVRWIIDEWLSCSKIWTDANAYVFQQIEYQMK